MQFIIDNVKYELDKDLHTHTVYSHNHAFGTIEENVLFAREKGLKTLGITDHGPGHVFYGIKREDVSSMRKEIIELNEKYSDIEILLGVEANIINNNGILDVRPEEFPEYDYVIAGYHYGIIGRNPIGSLFNHGQNLLANKTGIESNTLMRKNTNQVVKALQKNNIKILTHPGDKAPVDLLEIAVMCAKTDTLVEINTWHSSLTAEDIKTMAIPDCKFIISSDAHTPDRIGDFAGGIRLAVESGIDLNRIVNLKVIG